MASMRAFEYDVFLSFYGEDTRRNFTDHLYTALKQAGIRTFRDDDAMERGRLLGPELKKAIRKSAISVIVFSKNYARSKWCLDEVLTIIEEKYKAFSKHEVVPLFYNIDPSDVRNQTGSFEEAFGGYEDIIEAERNPQKKEWSEKVKAWRACLRTAGSLTGMVLTGEGYEAKFITDVVMNIRKKVDCKTMFIDENLVGMDSDVVEIESWLQDPSPNAVILFLVGMGGMGKTTIAKCIYNINSHKYDGSCFLADINESSKPSERLCRLQSQLVSEILKSGHEETIWNVHIGTTKIANAISNKKVLLILDDVTTEEQLNAILGRKRFYPGTKVIITTRHKELVNAFTLPPNVHNVTELSIHESLKLFSLFCFHQDQPIEPYIVQSKQVVDRCVGLPLALKVLGSTLRGKNMVEWEDVMHKLEAIQHPGIQNVLRLSYDSLEDTTDKDLFLHIACFFVGKNKDYIVKILAECNLYPTIGIKNLKDRCLVYERCGKVCMHQLIKEMGQEVVRQESPNQVGKRSRLWRHEDGFKVLQEHEGTKKVVGFMLDMRNMEEPKSTSALKMDNVCRKPGFRENPGTTMLGNGTSFKFGALEKMSNILLLQLKYVTFFGKYKKLPNKLRLLSWHGFSGDYIPTDICLDKLVVLDMRYSKLKCVWNNFKVIGTLKILNLSYCIELIKTPDFRGLPGLESLILIGCLRLTKVDDSISCLEGLVSLDLTNCRSLRHIPHLPTSLLSLEISGCSKLEGFRCLDSLSLCSFLVEMDISCCNLFDESFPDDWSNLSSLYSLSICENNITSLPKCIQSLPGLTFLHANKCSNARAIIGLPKSLQVLTVNDNMSLEEVQTAQCPTIHIQSNGSWQLCHVEGWFKLQSIYNVDTKVIQYLGLESIMDEGVEMRKQKVLLEYGIFSTIVSEKLIPSKFRYRERGPTISFKVPLHHSSSRICGLSICSVISKSDVWHGTFFLVSIDVYNNTKELLWEYNSNERRCDMDKFGFLTLWRCGNLLEVGEEITIHIWLGNWNFDEKWKIVETCVNLVYEDEEVDGKRKDFNVFDQISWMDRVYVDISNYMNSGKLYLFRSPVQISWYKNFKVESDIYSWVSIEEDGHAGKILVDSQWRKHTWHSGGPHTYPQISWS